MPVTHTCENCGGNFQTAPSYRGRFCSKECSYVVNRRHGLTQTPEHRAWKHMRNRCTNPKCRDYRKYGGRGIKIAARWDIFENFLADMGPRPSKDHSIERKDNNGDYCPQNCKWATKTEQTRNRSISWTPEQDAAIRASVAALCSYKQMAAQTGRTESAVQARASRLGLKIGVRRTKQPVSSLVSSTYENQESGK